MLIAGGRTNRRSRGRAAFRGARPLPDIHRSLSLFFTSLLLRCHCHSHSHTEFPFQKEILIKLKRRSARTC